jgi:uncharacterized membrane protein HdeD (DUF308 family)
MSSTFENAQQSASKELKRARWALGLSGVLAIAVAVAMLVWPNISIHSLVIVFGIFAVARGLIGLVAASRSPVKDGRGWLVFNSLLSIAVGVVVFWRTDMSALALLYVIGFYAIAMGVIEILAAYRLPFASTGDRILFVLLGAISIVFGVVMFVEPGDGALAVLALISAYLLIVGLIELTVAIGGEKLVNRVMRSALTPSKPRKTQPSH